MTMKTILAAAVATTVMASPVMAQDKSDWPSNFTIGTASQGGTYFAYGAGWANYMAENLGISGGAEITGGPMQNMALVHTGDLNFGLTTMGRPVSPWTATALWRRACRWTTSVPCSRCTRPRSL